MWFSLTRAALPLAEHRHLPADDATKNIYRRGDLRPWQRHQDERRQHQRRQASDA